MTLDEARAAVGRYVRYKPAGQPDRYEVGIITFVNDRYVFVRYRGDIGAKATDPADLDGVAP